jgi:hypothetical protein
MTGKEVVTKGSKTLIMDVPLKLKCHIGQMFWHGGSFAKMTQDT